MAIELSTQAITVDGAEYILTLGTGERYYGADGGMCAFAYDATDYRATAARVDSYAALCEELDTIRDRGELRRIAIAAAARYGHRVTIAGSCDPVLSDDEYRLVRDAVEALV